MALGPGDAHRGPDHASRLEWLAAQGFEVGRVGLEFPNAADRAARDGDVEALRRAMAEEGLEVRYRWAYDAAKAGHVGVVAELRARGVLSLRDAAHGAAEGGQLQLLERLLGSDRVDGVGPRVDPGQGHDGSAGGGAGGKGASPARAEEEEEGEGDGSSGSSVAGEVAEGEYEDLVSSEADEQDDLHEALHCLLDAAVSSDAPSVEVLRWLRARGCPWEESVFAAAAPSCSVEAVEWMAAEGCPMGVGGGGRTVPARLVTCCKSRKWAAAPVMLALVQLHARPRFRALVTGKRR